MPSLRLPAITRAANPPGAHSARSSDRLERRSPGLTLDGASSSAPQALQKAQQRGSGLSKARTAGGAAGDADADLEMGARRDADDAATDLGDRLACAHHSPDRDKRSLGVPVIDVAAIQGTAGDVKNRRCWPEAGHPLLDNDAIRHRDQYRRTPAATADGRDIDPLVGRPRARLHDRSRLKREYEPLSGAERIEGLYDLQLPPDLSQRRCVSARVAKRGRPRGARRSLAGHRLDRLRMGAQRGSHRRHARRLETIARACPVAGRTSGKHQDCAEKEKRQRGASGCHR